MGTSRTVALIWLIWSCMWAAFWFVAGFATLGLGWIAMLVSVGVGVVPFMMTRPRPTVVVPPPQYVQHVEYHEYPQVQQLPYQEPPAYQVYPPPQEQYPSQLSPAQPQQWQDPWA